MKARGGPVAGKVSEVIEDDSSDDEKARGK